MNSNLFCRDKRIQVRINTIVLPDREKPRRLPDAEDEYDARRLRVALSVVRGELAGTANADRFKFLSCTNMIPSYYYFNTSKFGSLKLGLKTSTRIQNAVSPY